MPPIPCAHCGNNFMRPTIDPEAPKLCNNCSVREEKRNPQNKANMDTVGILIKCPKDVQIEIEELCINKGVDFTRYFLELHYGSQAAIETMNELTQIHSKELRDVIHDPKDLKQGKPDFVITKKEVLKQVENSLPKKKGGK